MVATERGFLTMEKLKCWMHSWQDTAQIASWKVALTSQVGVEAKLAVGPELHLRAHSIPANTLAWQAHYHLWLEGDVMDPMILNSHQADIGEDYLEMLAWEDHWMKHGNLDLLEIHYQKAANSWMQLLLEDTETAQGNLNKQ